MNGWTGKILRVDLTSGEIADEALDPKVARDYVGGRGLGIYYLNKEMDPTVDPLSPENIMCMFTGPLTGTRAATGARYMIMTKSPLTGALTTSNSGGHFPTEMKRAGYDGIIVKGRAAEPMYLYVTPGKAELRSAGHLWGKDTAETTDLLFDETDPKARVACIGPAGERLVRFASVMNEKHRAAGRSGVGAVMGSKNLKAVVVKAEGKDVPLHDPEGFAAFHKGVIDTYNAGAAVTPVGLSLYGTTYAAGHGEKMGDLPTKNFQNSKFKPWEGGIEKEFHEKHFIRRGACFSCPIGCARISKVEKPEGTLVGEGPEYETWFAMGSNCLIADLAPIVEANFACNRLGFDTITMGVTLACAMELVDRGYLDEAEVGRSLRWGDGEALVELAEKTGNREGFGDLLAEGKLPAGREIRPSGTGDGREEARDGGLHPQAPTGDGRCVCDVADRGLAHARRHRLPRAVRHPGPGGQRGGGRQSRDRDLGPDLVHHHRLRGSLHILRPPGTGDQGCPHTAGRHPRISESGHRRRLLHRGTLRSRRAHLQRRAAVPGTGGLYGRGRHATAARAGGAAAGRSGRGTGEPPAGDAGGVLPAAGLGRRRHPHPGDAEPAGDRIALPVDAARREDSTAGSRRDHLAPGRGRVMTCA